VIEADRSGGFVLYNLSAIRLRGIRTPGAILCGVRLKPFNLKAILTDSQFWVPLVVLALGIALLAFLH
jgi:hypothetical protein